MTDWLTTLDRKAELRARAGLTRRLHPRSADERVIDLAGNDYLGLARHPEVIAAAARALAEYGLGATGSRLVRGSTELHAALEADLAGWLGTEAALIFSSGFLANLGAVRALAGPRTLFVSDAHNHASLVDGCRSLGRWTAATAAAPEQAALKQAASEQAASGSLTSGPTATGPAVTGPAASKPIVGPAVAEPAASEPIAGPMVAGPVSVSTMAQTVVTPHGDVAAVEAVLAGAPGRPAVVVTESVFSVDGDLGPLRELHAVTRRYGALLLIDDAHGLGVTGPRGAGAVAGAGLAGEPDVVVTATLSKALGGSGGVIAGPAALIRHLIDTGRTFIYDTALPPAVIAGVHAALRVARNADDRRAELSERARVAARRLAAPGTVPSVPAGAVVSVPAPSAQAAVGWAAACRDRGVAVGCFRPPTTPDSRSRLRLTINVGVPRDDFDKALDVVAECAP